MKHKHVPCILLSFLLCYLSLPPGYAQVDYTRRPEYIKANSNWIFGSWWDVDDPNNGTGISFNTNPPAILIGTGLTSAEAAATVSDTATGALLFYSNAERCWNRNYQVMPNGDNLMGGRSTNQGAYIAPVIDSPGKYYLFTLQAYNFGTSPPGLYYSKVDMSLDGGLGDIVPGQKNLLLDSGPLQESMLLVPGNNCDLWLIVHPYYDPEFRAYHITSAGIDPNPVVSNTGPAMAGAIAAYELGGMAISPDRSLLAITSYSISCYVLGLVPGLGGTMLTRFDAGTGQISSPLYLADSTFSYQVCFSPDNTKLYGEGVRANASGTAGAFTQVIQLDVSNYTQAAINSSRTVLFSVPYGSYRDVYGFRRRGDTIIMADMSYISSPNQPGLACSFHGPATPLFVIDSISSNIALGCDAVYPLPPDTLFVRSLDTAVCSGTSLELDAPATFSAYQWSDGSSGNTLMIADTGRYWVRSLDPCHSRVDTFVVRLKADARISLGPDTLICGAPPFRIQPVFQSPGGTVRWMDGSTSRTYDAREAGTYYVSLSLSGCTDTDSITIAFRDLRQDLGPDKFVCKGDPVAITLKADVPSGASTSWSTGSNDATITLTDTGNYWVTVSQSPCYETDSIRIIQQICYCKLNIPTAFSPNGDGTNDIFLPLLENGCPVKQYSFSIYNRYGQRVYFSADPAQGWDGTSNNQPADAGTYFYQVRFLGGVHEKEYLKKGDLLLIR